MIEVDISNIWGQVSLPDLLAMEKEVFDAHAAAAEKMGETKIIEEEQLEQLQNAAEKIRLDSDICVVLGMGGSCLAARGVIELLQGQNRNSGRGEGDPQILFAGNSLSTRHWNGLLQMLEGKDFSVIVISAEELPTEAAIAFRRLRWMLERKYGTEEACGRIYVSTDSQQGVLHQMAEQNHWEEFAVPRDSVLTAAGLLPLAVAGLDLSQILLGAAEAKETYDLRAYENPVWLYAAVRELLSRNGTAVELVSSFEPDFRKFGNWWQQLLAGTGQSILPVAAEFPEMLYALKQQKLLATMVRFAEPESPVSIGSDWNDLDELNYLEGKTLSFVEEQAASAALNTFIDGDIPAITMDCGTLTEQTLGELLYFLELSSGISAEIQRGDSTPCGYSRNLLQALGKPGLDD